MNGTFATARQLVSGFGQQDVFAVYQIGLSHDLGHVISKSLEAIEYHTVDENNESITVVMDVTEATDLLGNLETVLGANR